MSNADIGKVLQEENIARNGQRIRWFVRIYKQRNEGIRMFTVWKSEGLRRRGRSK